MGKALEIFFADLGDLKETLPFFLQGSCTYSHFPSVTHCCACQASSAGNQGTRDSECGGEGPAHPKSPVTFSDNVG